MSDEAAGATGIVSAPPVGPRWTRLRKPLLCACALLAACSSSSPIASSSAALGEAEQGGAAVAVLDSGHYFGTPVGDGFYYDSIWVDLSVRNDGFDKQVGIVWSNDGWTTTHVAAAHYKGALDNGHERWGLDVKDAVGQGYGPGEVEYAGFATIHGQTSWSVFRNHYIYNRVTPSAPLRLLQSGADLDTNGRATVRGVVRALNVAAPRRVFVRYTFDGWRSFAEVEAQYTGPDFAFAFPFAGDAVATDEAAFAIRLEAGGETAWENNGGSNYHVRLAPSLLSSSWNNAPSSASSGPKILLGGLVTSLPITSIRLRFDDGSVVGLPRTDDSTQPLGFNASGGFQAMIDTSAFLDGAQGVAIEATAGPFVRTWTGPTWLVDHGIRSMGGTAIGNGETTWDFATTASGHTLVLTDNHVLDYAALDAAPTVFEAASPTGLGQLALDGAGHVYALGATNLIRWQEDGSLDRSFGNAGELALLGTYAGTALCYSSDVAADASGFVIVDSCNARVLRFGVDGSFVDALSLLDTVGLGFALRVVRLGDRLWVSGATFSDGASHWQLIELSTPVGAPMELAAAHPVSGDVEFFAVAADGFWTTYGSNLYRLGADGTLRATWTGIGNAVTSLPGNLGIARRVDALADGSVTVLSVEGSQIQRFTAGPPPSGAN